MPTLFRFLSVILFIVGLVYGAMETLPAAATADHEAVRDTRRHVHAMLEGLRRVGTPGESA